MGTETLQDVPPGPANQFIQRNREQGYAAQRERNLAQEAAVCERLPALEAVLRLQLPRC